MRVWMPSGLSVHRLRRSRGVRVATERGGEVRRRRAERRAELQLVRVVERTESPQQVNLAANGRLRLNHGKCSRLCWRAVVPPDVNMHALYLARPRRRS